MRVLVEAKNHNKVDSLSKDLHDKSFPRWGPIGPNNYRLECKPGVLFLIMGFWARFYSNLTYLGLYLRFVCFKTGGVLIKQGL